MCLEKEYCLKWKNSPCDEVSACVFLHTVMPPQLGRQSMLLAIVHVLTNLQMLEQKTGWSEQGARRDRITELQSARLEKIFKIIESNQ